MTIKRNCLYHFHNFEISEISFWEFLRDHKRPFCVNCFWIDFHTRNHKDRESWSTSQVRINCFGFGPELSLSYLISIHFVLRTVWLIDLNCILFLLYSITEVYLGSTVGFCTSVTPVEGFSVVGLLLGVVSTAGSIL